MLPLGIKELRYIVVGTGRCGTVFFAKLLSSLGIPCGHETFFQCDGMECNLARLANSAEMPSLSVSAVAKAASRDETWFGKNRQLEADSSYMAAPFLDQPCFENTSVIHVVRHPLKVINSFLGFGYFQPEIHTTLETTNGWLYSQGDYHRFIYNFVPELLDSNLTPVDRAALYYVRWNELIESKSTSKKYLFQRVEDSYSQLFDFVGRMATDVYDNRQANAGNAEEKIHSLEAIPDEECRRQLIEIGRRYGYLEN